ncbi:MAG TPA: BlaI/MecI/CopY family transcriptional regulator [Patescibacteria group bacterium]
MNNLGPLERDILHIVWKQENASVKTVLAELTKKKQHLAYTTVMTILSRLVAKGVLRREKEGRLFLYKPAEKKQSFIRSLIHSTLATFVNRFGEEAITAFLEEAQDISTQDRKKYLKKLK